MRFEPLTYQNVKKNFREKNNRKRKSKDSETIEKN